jgi:hypothetical protein
VVEASLLVLAGLLLVLATVPPPAPYPLLLRTPDPDDPRAVPFEPGKSGAVLPVI